MSFANRTQTGGASSGSNMHKQRWRYLDSVSRATTRRNHPLEGRKIVGIMVVHFRHWRCYEFLLCFKNCLWNKHLGDKKGVSQNRSVWGWQSQGSQLMWLKLVKPCTIICNRYHKFKTDLTRLHQKQQVPDIKWESHNSSSICGQPLSCIYM